MGLLASNVENFQKLSAETSALKDFPAATVPQEHKASIPREHTQVVDFNEVNDELDSNSSLTKEIRTKKPESEVNRINATPKNRDSLTTSTFYNASNNGAESGFWLNSFDCLIVVLYVGTFSLIVAVQNTVWFCGAFIGPVLLSFLYDNYGQSPHLTTSDEIAYYGLRSEFMCGFACIGFRYAVGIWATAVFV